jgi:hypothetical protein
MTYLPEAEAYVFAAMDTAARALLRRGFDVIMDETCTTERTLLRYLSIDIEAQPIWIETSAEVCKARAIAGGKEYLLGPIGRMEKQVRLLKDGYDEIRKRLVEYVLMRRSR